MAEDKRATVLISAETVGTVKAYAEKHGITNGEAADRLIATAASRLAALARYAKNKEPQAPGKPRAKKAAKKAAAKPKAKAKASKAKAAAKRPSKPPPAPVVNGAAAHT